MCCRRLYYLRLVCLTVVLVGFSFAAWSSFGQTTSSLKNGNFEEVVEGSLTGWQITSNVGALLQIDEATPFEGKRAAKIEAVAKQGEKSKPSDGFSNLMQPIDAAPYRGKRILFRAAVKAEELGKSSKVQLWCRADSKDEKTGQVQSGAFDNMDQRPIRSAEWTHYNIVLDIQNDATSIYLGVFLLGTGQAYLDDVTFTEAPSNTPTTGASIAASKVPLYQPPPAVKQAMQAAEDAPRQSFWTAWLVLPAMAITLFTLGLAPVQNAQQATDITAPSTMRSRFANFCFHFTFLYWMFHCVPNVLASAVPGLGALLVGSIESVNAMVIEWTARNVFQIGYELVPPNGSGDTTYNYISIFIGFVVSFAFAIVWAMVEGRPCNFPRRRDALQIGLRYSLALTMVVYGLAKLSFEFSQFPPPRTFQLDKTWGDSSPMNVLWTFMGYSRAYTFFSGIGELVSGVLLLFRRTSVLGALIGIGIMANVVMLNFSYDVPVKIMSSHLLVMACLIVLPNAIRIANVFLFNRPTAAADLVGPWTNPYAWWTKAMLKTLLIITCVVLPVAIKGTVLVGELQRMSAKESSGTESDYRLTKRGFRWVSEVPFNR